MSFTFSRCFLPKSWNGPKVTRFNHQATLNKGLMMFCCSSLLLFSVAFLVSTMQFSSKKYHIFPPDELEIHPHSGEKISECRPCKWCLLYAGPRGFPFSPFACLYDPSGPAFVRQISLGMKGLQIARVVWGLRFAARGSSWDVHAADYLEESAP